MLCWVMAFEKKVSKLKIFWYLMRCISVFAANSVHGEISLSQSHRLES